MNKTNKEHKYYNVLAFLFTEKGILVFRPDNEEKHLAYITLDRVLHFKDDNQLLNHEISYLRDNVRTHPSDMFTVPPTETQSIACISYKKHFTKEGFSGVLPTGVIVDRRIFPNATPMKKDEAFGIPHPKVNLL